jgi:hypothetical protein
LTGVDGYWADGWLLTGAIGACAAGRVLTGAVGYWADGWLLTGAVGACAAGRVLTGVCADCADADAATPKLSTVAVVVPIKRLNVIDAFSR